MNPVRNWVLIGLFFAAASAAFIWYSIVPLPEFVLDPAVEPTEETLAAFLVWLVGLAVFGLAAALCFVLWFVLSNQDMNRLSGGRFLTPVWTVLLFVPLVQFVSFYMMAQHIRHAQAATGRTGIEPVVLFVFMWLLLPLGMALAGWQMQRIKTGPDGGGLPAGEEPALDWRPVEKSAGIQQNVERTPLVQGSTPSAVAGSWILSEETLHAGPVPAGLAASPSEDHTSRPEPELVPMPASGVAACFFCVASVPLGLLGPAGIASSVAGLYARERFLDLRLREPGHRGGRLVSRLHWVALVGMLLSFIVSAGMLGAIFAP